MSVAGALRSPPFARATIVFLAIYTGLGAWLPWSHPGGPAAPGWARAAGLDAPFSSPLFLAGCAALFASTLACTWRMAGRIRKLRRGEEMPGAVALAPRPGVSLEAFLAARGFRGSSPLRTRLPAALWGGFVLHVGILSLMAGVLVQRACFDGGQFEVTAGGALRLDAPGALRGRQRGVLAPPAPPPIDVALELFDPSLHEVGYAPDRRSRVTARLPGTPDVTGVLDRARGLEVGGYRLYQATPTGLALGLAMPGGELRSVHLSGSGREQGATFVAPGGVEVRFAATSERPPGDPAGTGAVQLRVTSAAESRELRPGDSFRVGEGRARLAELTWWAGFTYARSPGTPAVLAGFALLFLGSALLVLPAGVARLGADGEPSLVFVAQGGADALRSDWDRWPDRPARG
ncbi:cytochrome c biogenesis protein ResB [Anaeromyxobacter paludicola]|uniref:ResB-like domain-containing protein n=1 Tax=Anaeromyxobacter paludicola TaxID=2918171 RepID=A0ABM7XAH1_9BACT|nr:cytochrome c biogenesis protein ResB [Anaeromyxobacter paludicola]BDG08848.1 hypothetical protein AMPC_19610 [Anaeromyxobacter paludicola]